jgi:hypothetical protein
MRNRQRAFSGCEILEACFGLLASIEASNFRALILMTRSALNLLFAKHAGRRCTLFPARRAPPVRGQDRVHL